MAELDRILCPHPMYGKLADRCTRAGRWLELHRVGSAFELRVVGKDEPPLATPCDLGADLDRAATVLLGVFR